MAKTSNALQEAFANDSGAGFEDVNSSDIQIPRLGIIQAGSPQLKKKEEHLFIKGASPGDIFNSVTKHSWVGDKGVVVIPVHFQHKLNEWIPRHLGGGFVQEHPVGSEEVKKAVRDKDTGMEMLESGNELVRTATHYVKIVHEDGSLESATLDMKKTQLKKSRLWLSQMTMQRLPSGATLPSFANMYRLKTVEEGNDKGSWYSYSISLEGPVPSLEAYKEAKEMHGSIGRGELRIAPPPEQLVVDQAVSDDSIPF
jgi:hypothetical protein